MIYRLVAAIVITVSLSLGAVPSIGLAQGDSLAKTRAAIAEFNSEQEALRAEFNSRIEKATSHLGQQDCRCDELIGTCETVSARIIPGKEISTYRIKVPTTTLEPRQCVKVSAFITTQKDVDNKVPVFEDLTFFRGGVHEEDISHVMMDGQVPIIAPGTDV